jgi:hypothetical protein
LAISAISAMPKRLLARHVGVCATALARRSIPYWHFYN